MNCLQIGNAVITRVVEWVGELSTADTLFPQTPASAWENHTDLIAPTFWNPKSNRCRLAIQTWVVQVDGLTVVVDTGVGNDRCRPQNPAFHRLRTDFLEALDIAGIDRNGVDVVVNTHLHLDHVGWNTRWHNGTWTPTFPNARYMVPAEDFRYFHPDNAATMRPARTPDEQARFTGMRLVFEDSVQPIADAGQLTMWSSDHQISPSLLLRAAAGHTPGSSVLWLNTIAAVFVGDLMHSPLQILRPDDACAFDLDAATAAVARRRVLSEAAQRRALVIPAHYPGRGGARVDADGEAFAPQDWLNLAAL